MLNDDEEDDDDDDDDGNDGKWYACIFPPQNVGDGGGAILELLCCICQLVSPFICLHGVRSVKL